MTTIACKISNFGVELACDSAWTHSDGDQTTSEKKIDRLASGALLGQAGDADARAVLALLNNVKTEKQFPTRQQLADTKVDFAGIFVLPNCGIYIIEIEKCRDEWSGQIYPAGRKGIAAVGSGRHLAIGAMSAGKSAREAVAIACDWDRNSRQPVHAMEITRRPRKPKVKTKDSKP